MHWSEIRAAHKDHSTSDWSFRQLASKDRDCLRRAAFDIPHPLRSLITYHLQPWPIFLGRQKLRELTLAAQGVSRLIRSIPHRLFRNDAERIARFYGVEEAPFVAEILKPPDGIAEALARGDFAASSTGVKCLEFNFGANLGGWETPIMADILLRVPMISRFIEQHRLPVTIANPLRTLLSRAIRHAYGFGLRDGDDINMALIASKQAYLFQHPAAGEVFEREFAAAHQEAKLSTRGRFTLSDGQGWELRQDRLYHQEHRIHSLLTSERTDADDIIFTAFKKRNLHIYNGPVSSLLYDKRNLALLSELGEKDLFTAAEQAVIRNHIPWTRRVTGGKSNFRGTEVTLPELLISERHQLVLKKARSSQGQDVVVGRVTPPAAWSDAVREAIDGGDWVAQEFVKSRPYLFQEGEEGCAPHDLVWGIFIFGDSYAGTTVRVLPEAAGGVVSAARGATKCLALELNDELGPSGADA